MCTYAYGGEDPHALVMVVDHNSGGMAGDAWVSSQVDKLLGYAADGGGGNPMMRFEAIEPQRPAPCSSSP